MRRRMMSSQVFAAYSSRVMWLKPLRLNSAEQYTTRIDTGISPSKDTELYVRFRLTNYSGGDQVCGARTGKSNESRFFAYSTRLDGRITIGKNERSSLGLNTNINEVLLNEYGTGLTYYNGRVVFGNSTASYINKNQLKHLQIFATSGYEPAYGTANVEVYAVRIKERGVLVRDFIPVRVGEVGYMYDRANPNGGPLGNGLYPNVGTGDFVLGPDV